MRLSVFLTFCLSVFPSFRLSSLSGLSGLAVKCLALLCLSVFVFLSEVFQPKVSGKTAGCNVGCYRQWPQNAVFYPEHANAGSDLESKRKDLTSLRRLLETKRRELMALESELGAMEDRYRAATAEATELARVTQLPTVLVSLVMSYCERQWLLVFRHDTRTDEWFSKGEGNNGVACVNSDNPGAPKYSIMYLLDDISLLQAACGQGSQRLKYTFRMAWPGTDFEDQVWRQSSNPLLKSNVEDYEPLNVPHKCLGWAGLKRTTQENAGPYHAWTYMDGDGRQRKHWYSVGMTRPWKTGYPGPHATVPCPVVELYLLI